MPSPFWQTGPAQKPCAVVIPCDGLAFPFALFLARQIIAAEPDRLFDVVIACGDRAVVPEGLETGPIRLIEVEQTRLLNALPRTRTISRASYYWMFLSVSLADDYTRILFLDADMYLRRPGLNALFTAPAPTHAVTAAPDAVEYTPRDDDGLTRLHRREDLPPEHIYRNGGVELVDTARMVEEDLLTQFVEFRLKLGRKVASTDQTALNVVGRDRLGLLSPQWNFLTVPWTMGAIDAIDPVLLHFFNHPKPWVPVPGFPELPYVAEYAAFLQETFPADYLHRAGIWGIKPPHGPAWNPLAKWQHSRAAKRLSASNLKRRADFDSAPRADADRLTAFTAKAEL
ncbi:hypothetical protein IV417_10020 [Alphaproteobacteria bacterium KMM 3653]|uniref:Lipopolysaccharide biosynthesis glycosyltransferase n=1 Tax=Harenicola maris TaxID=2841044 RepID=A0AAP2CSH0_9RHOB|nr:hypothetical protein [Harenicola maris]